MRGFDSPNANCSWTSKRRSMSPAIHSDPELNRTWWERNLPNDNDDEEVVNCGDETKEWNICPEGYDYSDAEHTRKLFFNSRRDRFECTLDQPNSIRSHRLMRHGNLTRCLFGADEDADDDETGPCASDSTSLEGETDDEDYGDECWDPLREFM